MKKISIIKKINDDENIPWYKWEISKLKDFGVIGWIVYIIIWIFLAIVIGAGLNFF
jgi:hypothetical protein